MGYSKLFNRFSIHLAQIRAVVDNPKTSMASLRFVSLAQREIEQEAANIAAEMFAHSTSRIPGGVFFLRELTNNLEKIGFMPDQISIAIDHATKFLNEKV